MLDRLDRHLFAGMPWGRFLVLLAGVSAAGLLVALWVYVGRTPGFAAHLAGTEGALGPFLRQVLTNGVPVVLAVNAAGLWLFMRLRAGRIGPGAALALDTAARVAGFAGLHAAVFAGSAVAVGAFGGDPGQGLAALGPTLARAGGFGNLAGAYFYATLATALPLHMAITAALRGGTGPAGLVAGALALFAAQALALSALGRVLMAVG